MARRSGGRGLARLQDLLERIRRINPTGRACGADEAQARYEEKARLQSLLIEGYPDEVRVQVHDDMPGIVSLSVPRLRASAAHAVLAALSARARTWVEEQTRAASVKIDREPAGARARSAPLSPEASPLDRAARAIAAYDFECGEMVLASLAADVAAPEDQRARALLMLLELHVDHLANDAAALELEPALRALAAPPPQAHELLGVAAARSGEIPAALRHLEKCRSERAATTLASLAQLAANARAWADAIHAWTLLQALAMTTEGTLAPSIAELREDLRRHLERHALEADAHALSTDEALVRFVREFAPAHPWLRERRESVQRLRAQASTRAQLDKAQASMRDGDLAGVERVLGSLARSAMMSPADATLLDELGTWVEARRAEVQTSRALALAAAGDAEAACRAYLALPERGRDQVRAAGAVVLFTALEALNAANAEQPNARSILRAAAAWAAAHRGAEATDADRGIEAQARLRLLAPHAALLESVPAFASEMRRLRALAMPRPAPAAPAPTPSASGPREVWIDGLCFADVDATVRISSRTMDVGPHALRVGAANLVGTLEALDDAGAWAVTLRSPGHHAPARHIRIEGPASFQPQRLLTTGQRLAIVDESRRLWLLDLTPELAVKRVDLDGLEGDDRALDFVAVDGDIVAVCPAATGASPETWRLVDMKTGLCLAELQGPRLHRARTLHGTTFHRASGSLVERLSMTGDVLDRFELPRGVIPSALVESPFSRCPLVLSLPSPRGTAMLWWRQPDAGLFRAVELCNANEHGAPIDAVSLDGRGLWIVTRRGDGATFLHGVQVRSGTLSPGHRPLAVEGHLGLVLDPVGRRGWSVRQARGAAIEIRPLGLPGEQD